VAAQDLPCRAVFALAEQLVEVRANCDDLLAAVLAIWRPFARPRCVAGPCDRRYTLIDLGAPSARSPLTHSLRAACAREDLLAPRRQFVLLSDEQVLFESSLSDVVIAHLDWLAPTDALTTAVRYGVFHSAVLSYAGQGLMLPAAAGSGKTTLTAALLHAGFHYLSDEAALVDPLTRRVYAYPKLLSVKQPATLARLLDLPPGIAAGAPTVPGKVWHLDPLALAPGRLREATTVSAIIFPRYRADSATLLSPLGGAKAALELLRCGVSALARPPGGLELAAALVGDARCFHLAIGDLAEAVRLVRRVFEGELYLLRCS
jgi:hypothetical protein